MTLRELQEAYRAGVATVSVDEAYPAAGVSRATFYRACKRGQVAGVLTLGRLRRIALGPYLQQLGATPDAGEGG